MPRLAARSLAAVSFAILAALATGCGESRKASEQSAADEVGKLAALAKTDVEQVRTGVPLGAQALAKTLPADFANDLAGLQRIIAATRGMTRPLDVSKVTFFSVADPAGTVLRSEADPDLLAGKNVISAFPPLKKALDPASALVEARGEMQETRGLRTGPDTTWIVAHPIVTDGKTKAVLVTGWSTRRFAFHLEDMAKRDLADAAQKTDRKVSPISYVFVVLGDKAYGAPLTPDVDAHAIEGLNLVERTKAGPYRGAFDVTGREFGVAAQRVPELGADAAVAIMVSAL
jgi:hypothetical protein